MDERKEAVLGIPRLELEINAEEKVESWNFKNADKIGNLIRSNIS